MRDFHGKVAVVTGGARGLGLHVARLLAREGARVALWDLDQAALDAALKELGPAAKGYRVDVTDPAQVKDAAARVERDLGPVDLLDNNAGVVYPGSFLELSDEQVSRTVAVNLESLAWCARAFLPGMIARNSGHLVFTASAAGLTGVPGMAVYSATKHAAVGLAESIRLELRAAGKTGIKTTIVCPSFIATGMFEGSKPPLGAPWLSPEALAGKIVAAVRADALYLREPFLIKFLPLLKALPSCVLDWVGDLTGMHRSLEGFRAHKS